MVRASPQEQTGEVGVSEVTADLQRIGWGPVHLNARHDLGTDLFVQVRDVRRFDRGLLVGVQAKGGPSWFKRPARAEDGSLLGWWYDEEHADHFEDWVTHGLPHLLVLHDLNTRVSYWVHVTAKVVESTGKGAKILVPVGQTIDHEHLDDLLDVAASHKPVIGLQGTAWAASASNLPPARAPAAACAARAAPGRPAPQHRLRDRDRPGGGGRAADPRPGPRPRGVR